MDDVDLLRALHDAYVWDVNAAVGEDRMDLVWRLSDEYAEVGLRLLTATASPGCGRPDCVICTRSGPTHHGQTPTTQPRRRWLARPRWRHAA